MPCNRRATVPSRDSTRRTAPLLSLLALLSLALALLIWGFSLAQSIERPSVGNVLEQRQLELEVLAERDGGRDLLPTGPLPPEQQLLETLQQSPRAGSSDSLLAQALLEDSLGLVDQSRRHLNTVIKSGPEDLRPLAETLLAPDPAQQPLPPLPDRPLYRLLVCEALQQPADACLSPATLRWASWRLVLVNLLPLFGVLAGGVLLLQQLWRRWRGQQPAAPELQGPDLTITETVLLIAGGFVVLGGLVTPLLAMPMLGSLLDGLTLTPALRAALEVLILYSVAALPAVAVLVLLLRNLPEGEGRLLQWLPSWQCWPQALRGLLMSLPLVALLGWLVERLWPDAGGSNPLLEEVLNGRSGVAIGLLAITATVLAPLFEEVLFRGVLLPVVGRRWGVSAGILVSALVFALAHLSLSEAPPLLALGIGLGWLRWSSGRLFSTVLMHSLWNGLTFVNLLLLGS